MKPSKHTTGSSFIKSMILVLILGLGGLANAQTYDEIGVNTSTDYDYGPIYRFSATSTTNYTNFAYLYLAAELNIPSGAVIYRVDWHAENGTGGLLDSNWFRIDMANTTQSTISVPSNNWNAEVTGATTVFTDTAYTITPGGGWVPHLLNTPFTYSGGNLKILTDFFRGGTATGAIDFHYESKSGLAAGASATSSARGNTFSNVRSNGRPDIRIYYLTQGQGTDVGIFNMSEPLSGVAQGQSSPVTVRIANYAGNTVTDLSLSYQLDNNSVVTESWSGSLVPGGYFDYTFTNNVTLPNFHRASLGVWINSVNNNGLDDVQTNDSISSNLCLPLNGNYTIGPDPGDDFPSILEAINAMECGNGISGPVQFLVKEGVYTDKLVINPINGASATNTVTFKGEKPTTSIIEYSSTVSAQRAAITIDGAQYIILDSLGIDASGNTYGWAIHLTGGAEHIVIKNNNIVLDTVNTGTNYNGIIATNSATSETSSTTLDDLLVENNTIYGGNHSVRLYGTSSNLMTNVVIRNNRFSSNYDYGIYLYYATDPLIDSNVINVRHGTPSSTSSAGIYLRSVNGGFTVRKNRIINAGQYGVYLNGCTGLSTSPSKIINNMIGGGFRSTSTSAAGIYMTGSSSNNTSYVDVYYNSINFDNGNGSAFNIRNAYSTNLRVMNNSFAYTSGGTGYAMYLNSTANVAQLDYNNYYSNGSNFVYYTANRSNLTNLMAVNSPVGNDANSISADPGYASQFDLRTIVVNLVDKGTPVSGITTDYYGNTRSVTTPVIGAHEFVPLPYDAGITTLDNPIIACGSSSAETITVTVFNFGTEVLTSIPVAYSINGATPVQETISTSLSPNASLQYSFTTPANLAGNGTYILKLYTGLLNDGKHTNDSITRTIQTGLAGPVYTVGGSSPDYATLNDAVDDLKLKGICGPIRFDIRPGTYSERIVIPSILGASATNTITFKGAGPNATVISHAPTVTTDRAAIVLDGAQYIIIDSIGIDASAGSYGWGIHLTNSSKNNVIRNNEINLSLTSTSSNYSGIIASVSPTGTTGGDAAHHTLIENNTINGGYTGIGFYGTTAIRLEGIEERNNRVEGYYYYGIYNSNVSAPKAIGNTLIHRGVDGSLYSTALYLNGPGPFVYTNNTIINGGQNGIMVTNSPIAGAVRSLIANNMVGGTFISVSDLASGIRVLGSSDVDIYFNTVNMTAIDGSGLFLVSTASNINVKNNCFAFTGSGSGYAATYESPGSLLSNDYNNYYSTNSNFIVYGSAVANLADLQALNSPTGNDLNSLSVNPYFVSDADVRVTRIILNGKGTPISGITEDIFGTTRNVSAPSIGAHEFVPLAQDAGISALISPTTTCGLTNSESVSVEIINYGSNVLTSVPVSYRLAGSTAVQETATVNLAINDVSNYVFTVPVTLAGNGPFYFEMWTELSGDMLAENDTFKAVVYKTLDGHYTLGTGGDFSSFAHAVEVLTNAGVCGPVEIEILAGTYNERVLLPAISGTSSLNTITFKGADPVNSVLRHTTTTSEDRAAFVIAGAEYVTLDSFTVDVTPPGSGTNYGWGIHVMSNSPNTTIRNMTVITDTTSSSRNYQPLIISNSFTSETEGTENVDSLLIQNNTLIGGYYSISLYGLSNTSVPKPNGYVQNLRVEDNYCYNSYYYGIYLNYTNTSITKGNTIRMRNGTNFQYGLYLYESVGPFRISNNYIYDANAYGVIVWYASADANDPGFIDNNIIGAGFNQNSNAATSGIRLFSTSSNPTQNIHITHNSVNFSANAGAAMQLSSSTLGLSGIEIYNNIFATTGGGNSYALNTSTSGAAGITRLNNNNYYGNGAALATHDGTVATDFAALQAINVPVGNDSNSLNIKPAFLSPIDLRLSSPDFYQKGAAAPGVPLDFFGKTRDISAPTIGAEEFIPLDDDISVQAILSPGQFDCGDSNNVITVVVKNLGLNTQTSIPIQVNISGSHTAVLTDVVAGPLTFGDADTFTFTNTMNFYSGALVDVEAFTSLPGDDNMDNDTVKFTSLINPKGINPVVSNDTVCLGGNAVLIANATSGTRLWFETENASLPFLSNQDTLKLNTVNAEESYFVENVALSNTVNHIGPVDNSIGTTSTAFFNDAEVFDAYTNIHLDSVKLIVDVAGSITMGLLDNAGNVIATKQVTVSLGTANYPLDFYVPAGTGYRLSMRSSSTGVRLFRNTTGADYPYTIPGLMSITGTTYSNQNYYYFFYDLQVRSYCASERKEVKAMLTETPMAGAIAPDANFQGTYAAGGVPNIDNACSGDTLVYVLNAPAPYSNTEYGDRWDISNVQIETSNGMPLNNVAYTAPVNGSEGKLEIQTGLNNGDSIFILSLSYNLAEGCSTSLSRYIYVSPKPQAAFVITDACDGDSIRFGNATTMQGNPAINYTWDFGDGSGSMDENPVHTYSTFGTYEISLVAQAQIGCPDTIKTMLNVFEQPVASFTVADSTCGNQEVIFNNTSTVLPSSSQFWHFNDGNTSSDVAPNHLYQDAGVYTVSLIVSQNGCKDSITGLVKVIPAPKAGYTAYNVCFGDSILFTNTSTSDISTTMAWNFGDLSTSTDNNPVHTYSTAGSYQVELISTAINACADTFATNVDVFALPMASFTPQYKDNGEVAFTADQSAQKSYVWNFGDAATGSGEAVSHRYVSNGSYDVTLKVTSNEGCLDSSSQNIQTTNVSVQSLNNQFGFGVYPNPFRTSTNISYELHANAEVKLEVYDVSGKLIQTLVSGEQNQGSYEVGFDGQNITGVYIVKLTVDGSVFTTRVVKLN